MRSTHKEMRGLWYLTYSALSLCLLVVMVFLPLAPAFADEVTAEATADTSSTSEAAAPTPTDTAPDESDTASDEPSAETEPSETPTPQDEEVTAEEIGDVADIADGEDIASNEGDASSEENTDTNDTTAGDVIEEDQPLADEVDDTELTDAATTTDDTNEVADEIGDEVVPEDVADTEEATDEATTTEEVITDDSEDIQDEVTPDTDSEATTTAAGDEVIFTAPINNANKFSFAENECTTSGDGTFYCVKTDTTAEVIHTDRIFAAIDAEGDKEIYVEKEGELIPLTSNSFDDDAPYYDEVSNTAVWHRLIDGRYQIISFDFEEEEETQLTNDHFNNMEPNRFGGATVWQGWVGNDWEIFFLEGDAVTMLTDNTTHDITPSVNGSHVVWQSFENNAWVMKVYDMRTKEVKTIEDTGGGSIENPRFVLVYDAKQETGDIETRGYDLKSGKVVQLGSVPVNLPDEIPEPDQTGEERALVTAITQLKPKTEDEGGDEPLPDATGSSTPNGDTDIVVPPIADIGSTTPTDIFEEDTTSASSTTDVVIPPVEVVETQDTSHIEDIIVTPYVEPIATSTDAQ